MVELNLIVGQKRDSWGFLMPIKEKICLTNEEAAIYLLEFLESKTPSFKKEWLMKAKGIKDE